MEDGQAESMRRQRALGEKKRRQELWVDPQQEIPEQITFSLPSFFVAHASLALQGSGPTFRDDFVLLN